jgi:hypothetical protein
MNASAGWTARGFHSSVAMPDGSIVLMGGNIDSGVVNDTWRSTNKGTTWTLMNASSGWSARASHSSVVMPDGSIVLMGGSLSTGGYSNDVWRSVDNGATWTLETAHAGWSARYRQNTVAMPDGSIVLTGGYDGVHKNDVWRSTDNGATWTQLPDAGWSARAESGSVAMPDGSLILMGGDSGAGGNTRFNDVWRFTPTGSSAQNPSHTYTTSGIYKVALQVYNINGYNSTRKAGYITVNPASGAPGEWNWSIDGWNGWSHTGTWSGTAVGPNYEYGPVIVNGHGEHGTYVNLLGGTTSATVGYTFNDPLGTGWNSLTFKGNITASDVPDGRWMTINVNNQQVFSGTATSFPPGNGQDFEIQRTFPQSGAVTINISQGQNSAFGNYFVMKFNSLKLT